MNYELTFDQTYKLLKPFLDMKFEGAKLGYLDLGDNEWYGVVKDNSMLIGHPSDDESSVWFSDGEQLGSALGLFNIDSHDFYLVLKKYLETRYPKIYIEKIW